MKRSVIALISLVALLLGVVLGSMAYLTDTAEATNVLTTGKAKIAMVELERKEDADGNKLNELQLFTQGQKMYPAVEFNDAAWQPVWPENDPNSVKYSVAGANDFFEGEIPAGAWNGMWDETTPNVKNVYDKMVFVENTGSVDVFYRTFIAVEAPGQQTGDDEIHLNINGNSLFSWENGYDPVLTDVVIGDSKYDIFVATYTAPLTPGEVSRPSLLQVGLDASVNNELFAAYGETVDIHVFSEAIQTEGFPDAKTALNMAFGDVTTGYHPWLNKEPANPVVVESAEELKKALADGEKDLVVVGADFTEKLSLGSKVNAAFVDCTFSGNNAWGYANNVSYKNCVFDSAEAAIHFDVLGGSLVAENCTFVAGKVQLGAPGTAYFKDCEFAATTQTSIWSEKGMRFYGENTTFTNCEFNNRVVLVGANGQPVTFNSCTMEGGQPVYYNDNTDGIIRGGNIPAVTINN